MQCVLCASERVLKLDTVSVGDLQSLYKARLGVAIDKYDVAEVGYFHCNECDLRFFSPSVVGDGPFYESLQKFPWYYATDKAEFRTALATLRAGARNVLEVGCGAARFAHHLPKDVRYVGLEFNDRAVAEARAAGFEVHKRSVESYAEEHPETVDAVFSFQVLEHVTDPGAFLRAAARLLRPGGRLIISVPAEDSLLAHEINGILNMPPHHQTRWSDVALAGVAQVTLARLVSIHHEPLEAWNAVGFAKAEVLRMWKRLSGSKLPLLSRLADTLFARVALRLVALPVLYRMRRNAQGVAGHTVTAVYEKAGGRS